MALIIHTAQKLDSVMSAIADVDQSVKSRNETFDMFLLFRRLDSSEEQELIKRVEAKGGAKACMEDDSILLELSRFRQELSQRQSERTTRGGVAQRGETRHTRHTRPSYGYQQAARSRDSVGSYEAAFPMRTQPWAQSNRYSGAQRPSRRQSTHINPPLQPYSMHRPLQADYSPASQPWQSSPQYPNPLTRPTDQTWHYASPAAQQPYPAETHEFYSPVPGYGNPPPAQPSAEVAMLRPLKTELNEDFDKTLEKNMVVFERQLDVQRRQLEHVVVREGDRVIAAVTSGPHDRILDLVRIIKVYFLGFCELTSYIGSSQDLERNGTDGSNDRQHFYSYLHFISGLETFCKCPRLCFRSP